MSAPSPTWNADQVITHLKSLGTEESRAGHGALRHQHAAALGISNAVLRPLGRALKRDHERALALWASGIREAKLLSLFTDEPKESDAPAGGTLCRRVRFLGDRRSRRRFVCDADWPSS